MELDRIDFDILRLLQKDARLMTKQIAEKVGLAPSSCHERIKKLKASSVILGSSLLLDETQLGFQVSAVVFVKISKKGQLNINHLMDQLISFPEIQHVYLVTGQYDLIIKMITKNMDHLKEIAYSTLSDSDEVISYETSIVYESGNDLSLPI